MKALFTCLLMALAMLATAQKVEPKDSTNNVKGEYFVPYKVFYSYSSSRADAEAAQKLMTDSVTRVAARLLAKEDTSRSIKMFLQDLRSMPATARRIIADTIFIPTSIAAGVVTCNISRFGYTNANSMNVQATAQSQTPVFINTMNTYSTGSVAFNCYNIVAGAVVQLTTLANLRIHIRIDGY